MFKNLEAELVRKDIKKEDVARLIGKTYKTVAQKINGKQPFTIIEGFLIRNALFPDLSMDYLFDGWNDFIESEKSENE